MADIGKSLIGQYGVYQVASHLNWMGYNAVPTSRNTKGVDLVVHNPSNDKAVGVQVKTMRQNHKKDYSKDFYAVKTAVPEEMEKEEYSFSNPFVFVYIHQSEKPAPRFFIAPKEDTFRLCREQWDKYVLESRHENIKETAKRKQPLSITIQQLEEYEDQWQNLGID
jgi:hypothetical protein